MRHTELAAEGFTTEPQELLEVVPVELDGEVRPLAAPCPAAYRDRILIDVIHDGNWVPEEYLVDRDGNPITFRDIEEQYVVERDWGASLVASRIAAYLGLPSFARVKVARVLMDFGRFPGSTPRHAEHLTRFAINYPFSKRLSYAQKKDLLERYYDGISDRYDELIEGKLIKIAVHTYDRFNDSGTERPPVSLLTRSLTYQAASELPAGLFDPLYPDVLAEFTADRVLRDRISLTLEKAKIPVAHNYPYLLPEGSLEVRYQVWNYFRFLRRRFEETHPPQAGGPGFERVWKMLMDTNLRSSDSESLRSYLHMYRRSSAGQEAEFHAAAAAYRQIRDFADRNRRDLLDAYRFSPERPSSLGLEVRKDIVCELDHEGRPVRPRWDQLDRVASTIARAISVYLHEDHDDAPILHPPLAPGDPWYAHPQD